MLGMEIVRCPNCGNFAERRWLETVQGTRQVAVLQTTCSICDYLMIMEASTGRVIEAYPPCRANHGLVSA